MDINESKFIPDTNVSAVQPANTFFNATDERLSRMGIPHSRKDCLFALDDEQPVSKYGINPIQPDYSIVKSMSDAEKVAIFDGIFNALFEQQEKNRELYTADPKNPEKPDYMSGKREYAYLNAVRTLCRLISGDVNKVIMESAGKPRRRSTSVNAEMQNQIAQQNVIIAQQSAILQELMKRCGIPTL